MPHGLMSPDEDSKKRKKAMQTRLKKLGTDNPVVKKAVEKNQPREDKAYEKFEIVHELVSAAFSEFAEGKFTMKESMLNLSKAIKQAAGTVKENSDHNSDHEDDDF